MNSGLASSIQAWLVNLTAITIFCLFIIPITLILSLNWIDPLTSSYMLGYEVSNHENAVSYEWKDWDEFAESVPLAVIAAEDKLFAQRSGFDFDQLKRVLNKQPQERESHTSIITRQTARNLFLWPEKNFLSNGLESWLTLLLEASLDKQRILEIFLNIVEFTPGVYGIEAASQKLFYKPANRLTNNESALLAAVLSKPEQYRANFPSALVEQQQRWIITQMKTLDQSEVLQILAGNYKDHSKESLF